MHFSNHLGIVGDIYSHSFEKIEFFVKNISMLKEAYISLILMKSPFLLLEAIWDFKICSRLKEIILN